MSKRLKIFLVVVGAVAILGILHLWLNVGFDKLSLSSGSRSAEVATFRVGFLLGFIVCGRTVPHQNSSPEIAFRGQ